MKDIETPNLPFLLRSNSRDSFDDASNGSDRSSLIKKREVVAWIVIAIQACALAFTLLSLKVPQNPLGTFSIQHDRQNPFSINRKAPVYHENILLGATSATGSTIPFFDPPTFYPENAGLVSRVWHSNGSPAINPNLKQGSCWCSGDDYCMCTPSLAIDLILTSGPDHVWLVRRKDKGLMALMGGFTEVGETVEEASRRELKEEMNIELPGQPLTLFGVYSDPKRDARKHAVSVVFHLDIPPHVTPNAGDDASEVVRIPIADVEGLDMFIDHKTVLRDFMKMRERQRALRESGQHLPVVPIPHDGDGEPFKRSVCELPVA